MTLTRSRTLAAIAAAALVLASCQEQLTGGNACPPTAVLCHEQTLGYRDTVLLASDAIDTMVTLPGIPSIGTEPQLLVARYAQSGDSVVSVAVFRFDTVTRLLRFADSTKADSPFVSVDSAGLYLTLLPPPTGQDTIYVQDTVTFRVYDVNVNAPDLDTAPVHAKFSGTPVGTLTLPRDSANGLVRVPIDTLWLTQAITTGARIRLGLEVVSRANVRVMLLALEGSSQLTPATSLQYFGHAGARDSAYVINGPQSLASSFGPAIPAMADYQMVFQGFRAPPAGTIAIGGLPSHRAYIRFKIPSTLVDSTTTVVRANLEMFQAPFGAFADSTDSVFMQPRLTLAAPGVTDLNQVAVLLVATSLDSMRTAKLPPMGTALDTTALVRTGANIFTFWRFEKAAVQRGIVLTMVREGLEPRQLLFYGTDAPLALRPRLHVSYVPRSTIGLP